MSDLFLSTSQANTAREEKSLCARAIKKRHELYCKCVCTTTHVSFYLFVSLPLFLSLSSLYVFFNYWKFAATSACNKNQCHISDYRRARTFLWIRENWNAVIRSHSAFAFTASLPSHKQHISYAALHHFLRLFIILSSLHICRFSFHIHFLFYSVFFHPVACLLDVEFAIFLSRSFYINQFNLRTLELSVLNLPIFNTMRCFVMHDDRLLYLFNCIIADILYI